MTNQMPTIKASGQQPTPKGFPLPDIINSLGNINPGGIAVSAIPNGTNVMNMVRQNTGIATPTLSQIGQGIVQPITQAAGALPNILSPQGGNPLTNAVKNTGKLAQQTLGNPGIWKDAATLAGTMSGVTGAVKSMGTPTDEELLRKIATTNTLAPDEAQQLLSNPDMAKAIEQLKDGLGPKGDQVISQVIKSGDYRGLITAAESYLTKMGSPLMHVLKPAGSAVNLMNTADAISAGVSLPR